MWQTTPFRAKVITVMFLAVFPFQPDLSQASDRPHWRACKGTGPVKQWEINDVCTLLRVTLKVGSAHVYSLKSNRSEVGFLSFGSMSPLTSNTLFVTHSQGGFTVNVHGQILRNLSRARPLEMFLDKMGGRRRLIRGPFEEPPGNNLVIRGSNSSTVACTYNEPSLPYVVLIDRNLNRRFAFFFEGKKIVSVLSASGKWLVVLTDGQQKQRVTIRNDGRLVKGPRL